MGPSNHDYLMQLPGYRSVKYVTGCSFMPWLLFAGLWHSPLSWLFCRPSVIVCYICVTFLPSYLGNNTGLCKVPVSRNWWTLNGGSLSMARLAPIQFQIYSWLPHSLIIRAVLYPCIIQSVKWNVFDMQVKFERIRFV